jgi:cyclic dehypoxanthinyl futalosine synthase
MRLHPEPFRTYNIDRNINYTNACTAVCDFCAFYRPPDHPEVYVLPMETLLKKIEETVALAAIRFCCRAVCIPKCRSNGTKICCEH